MVHGELLVSVKQVSLLVYSEITVICDIMGCNLFQFKESKKDLFNSFD